MSYGTRLPGYQLKGSGNGEPLQFAAERIGFDRSLYGHLNHPVYIKFRSQKGAVADRALCRGRREPLQELARAVIVFRVPGQSRERDEI